MKISNKYTTNSITSKGFEIKILFIPKIYRKSKEAYTRLFFYLHTFVAKNLILRYHNNAIIIKIIWSHCLMIRHVRPRVWHKPTSCTQTHANFPTTIGTCFVHHTTGRKRQQKLFYNQARQHSCPWSARAK